VQAQALSSPRKGMARAISLSGGLSLYRSLSPKASTLRTRRALAAAVGRQLSGAPWQAQVMSSPRGKRHSSLGHSDLFHSSLALSLQAACCAAPHMLCLAAAVGRQLSERQAGAGPERAAPFGHGPSIAAPLRCQPACSCADGSAACACKAEAHGAACAGCDSLRGQVRAQAECSRQTKNFESSSPAPARAGVAAARPRRRASLHIAEAAAQLVPVDS
jgi:hypothetical protein